MALRKIGPLLLAALAVAGAATGLGGCHDVGLYLLRANPTDGGGGQGGVGVPTDGPTDVPVDMGNPIACSNDPMVGFATLGSITDAGVYHASTTGGGHQASTPVSTLGAFMTAVADDTPSVIVVSGLLQFASVPDGGTSQLVKVGSNKTIIGAANSGLVGGGLDLTGSANIIIRNLKISQVYHSDAIHLQYTQNVWIDHCDLSCDPSQPTACDDLIGISHASDLVTISWTWFHDHHDTTLIGHSDSTTATTEDATHLNVTLHHDLYSNISGGPRARIGYVHVFNLDFEQVDDYGVASTTMARVLVEGTFFNNVKKALTTTLSTSPDGYITEGIGDRMNVFAGTTPIPTYNTQVIVTSPNYPTPPLDQASRVPTLTQACAGVDKVDPMVNLP